MRTSRYGALLGSAGARAWLAMGDIHGSMKASFRFLFSITSGAIKFLEYADCIGDMAGFGVDALYSSASSPRFRRGLG